MEQGRGGPRGTESLTCRTDVHLQVVSVKTVLNCRTPGLVLRAYVVWEKPPANCHHTWQVCRSVRVKVNPRRCVFPTTVHSKSSAIPFLSLFLLFTLLLPSEISPEFC